VPEHWIAEEAELITVHEEIAVMGPPEPSPPSEDDLMRGLLVNQSKVLDG